MTEPIAQHPEDPDGDPSDTDIEQLTAPLDPEDDVHNRITLVHSSTDEDLRGSTS